MYEYKVIKSYYLQEWDKRFEVGEIYNDSDFPEPDIPANLVGRGVLAPNDEKAEAARLKPDAVKVADNQGSKI